MKKTLALSLAMILLLSFMLAACSSDKSEDTSDSTDTNLESYDNEVGFELDEDGNEIPVIYKRDKNGNIIAVKLGNDGEPVTDEDGKEVTVDTTYKGSTEKTTSKKSEENTDKLTTTTTEKPTGTTKPGVPGTSSADTTKFEDSEKVPGTDDSGKEVNFSPEDQNTIKSMLEVPYLYLADYENDQGVPISIACHVAVWMAEREGNLTTTYPSSPVVLNLFKYFGQTVVNFKTQCNDFAANAKAPITYNKKNDNFTITEFTKKKHTVSITKIEDLGDNNFYKVTGNVEGCNGNKVNKKKVVAIIQKNRLDTTLGFSIKALKWS